MKKTTPTLARLAFAVVAIGLLIALRVFSMHRPQRHVPLDTIPALRNIREPITITGGIQLNDGGSKTISFLDNFNSEYRITLLDTLEGERNVVFSCVSERTSVEFPFKGDEEVAILGLLRRWFNELPEARRQGVSTYTGDESEPEIGEYLAWCIMHLLANRNS